MGRFHERRRTCNTETTDPLLVPNPSLMGWFQGHCSPTLSIDLTLPLSWERRRVKAGVRSDSGRFLLIPATFWPIRYFLSISLLNLWLFSVGIAEVAWIAIARLELCHWPVFHHHWSIELFNWCQIIDKQSVFHSHWSFSDIFWKVLCT